MDPSVNYSLMVQERGKYPAFPFKLFFQLIGPKHAIALLVAWTGVCVWVWGGGSWVNVCWVCAAVLSQPLPYYSLFFFPIIDPSLVTFWKM